MATNGSGWIADRAEELCSEAQQLHARLLAVRLADRLGMRKHADRANELVRAIARERPILTSCCAAGVSFLLGRLASRI